MMISELIKSTSANRWTEKQAWTWYDSRPWLVGCNFVPSSAINQLEMWQKETFSLQDIDRELGWLADLGMNSMRVFLHDLVWKQDGKGFLERIEQYLEISHRHKIGTMFVFFDSVWHPYPQAGRQREPEPGVHNSGWVQSPGLQVLRDKTQWDRLEDYVSAVIQKFCNDERVDLWDLWNEPDNSNTFSYGSREPDPQKKAEIILPLLAETFLWARRMDPSQPLTSGVWRMDQFKKDAVQDDLPQLQLHASDVISFHIYESLANTQGLVEQLKKLGRPILCSEYLAREPGNTFQQILPYFAQEKLAAYNWGGVSGRSQTIYPWDTWQNPLASEPPIWQHDIFRKDGSAYDREEISLIKSLCKNSG